MFILSLSLSPQYREEICDVARTHQLQERVLCADLTNI